MVASVLALCWPSPASTQEDAGRWWWDARVGVGQVLIERSPADSPTVRNDQDDLLMSFGINGFIVHPAIARFRVGTDLLLSRVEGGSNRDSDRIGLGADLAGLPEGAYPFRLYYFRRLFDYSEPEAGFPPLLFGFPDTNTRWGGSIRMRRGPFRGMQAGLSRNSVDFVDPGFRPESHDREFVSWLRPGLNASHQFHLEHRRDVYGPVALDTEDRIARLTERVRLASRWNWELSGNGLRRDAEVADGVVLVTEDYSLRNRFTHQIRERDFLDVLFNLRNFGTDTLPTRNGQEVGVYYRWRVSERWELTPFGRFNRIAAAGYALRSPNAGLNATWNRSHQAWATSVTVTGSYGRVGTDQSDIVRDESLLGYGFSGSVSYDRPRGFDGALQLRWFRNELGIDQEPIEELPDLGLRIDGLGTDDSYSGRFLVNRAWDSRKIDLWLEWRGRRTTDAFTAARVRQETWLGGGQWQHGRFAARLDGGETDTELNPGPAQTFRFANGMVSWRMLRYLTLDGRYNVSRRALLLTPDIDHRWAEARARVFFGNLTFEVRVWERREDVSSRGTNVSRGVNWHVYSRFNGWLPIVSGTKRRGVIR